MTKYLILLSLFCSFSWADVKFRNSTILEEPGVAKGTYIAPNEHEPYLFNQVTTGMTGALISVGSFRTLDRSAGANFSHVFMVDYDQITTEFNRLNLELIRHSADRYDYIEMLAGMVAPEEAIAAVRHGELGDAMFLHELQTKGKRLLVPNLPAYEKMDQLLGKQRNLGSFKSLREHLFYQIGIVLNREHYRKGSIFGSDAIFHSVQQRARRGGFTVFNASFTGGSGFPTLAAALKLEHVEVAAVDLSNVMDHVHMQEGLFSSKPQQLVRNLQLLPLAKDAQILFTAQAYWFGIKEPGEDPWGYLALSKDDYFRAAELGHFDTSHGYEKFLQNVFLHKVDFLDVENARLIVPSASFKLVHRATFLRDWCKSRMNRLLTSARLKAFDLFIPESR
jgi:hypothetical protein